MDNMRPTSPQSSTDATSPDASMHASASQAQRPWVSPAESNRSPIAVPAFELDDCWNRIGVRGDRSCERLAAEVHCRNCPVFARAATMLLDRPRPVSADPAAFDTTLANPVEDERHATESVLVFRLGDEWLGLPTRALRQVSPMRTIHRVPHRAHAALLGVVNIQGALRLCIALSTLLGVETSPGDALATKKRRMLVVDAARNAESAGEGPDPVVFPVDDIDGVHRFRLDAREAVPATVAGKTLAHAVAVLRLGERTIGLLDSTILLDTLERSLR